MRRGVAILPLAKVLCEANRISGMQAKETQASCPKISPIAGVNLDLKACISIGG
jgi:hypothetical protein